VPVSDRQIHSTATPGQLWDLVARPDLWNRWSPHVRGAEGLGSPEVRQGARGKVVLRGGIKVPAEILEVTPGQSWSWQVGGIVVHHIVRPATGGSSLAMPVESKGQLWTPAALAYAPVVDLIARRIARVAEDEPGRS
jgi:hypothetical protein